MRFISLFKRVKRLYSEYRSIEINEKEMRNDGSKDRE
jgi:hypothetical protein